MVETRRNNDRVLVSQGDYHAVVRLEEGRVRCGAARLPYSQDALLAAAALYGWESYEQALMKFFD